MAGMDSTVPASRSRGVRPALRDASAFADPALWAWIAVAVMLVVPALRMLA
jgi:hypothetical protein